MNAWSDIRRLARARHRELVGDDDYSADSLLEAAAALTGHRSRGVEADNPRLEKGEGKLDLDRKVIWYNADAPPEQQHFVQAHEFAHVWLETGGYACLASEIDEQASEDRGAVGGAARVEGYSPRERAEREANVFAREFLLPTDTLRAWYEAGLSASDIASRVGVSRSLVFHQLGRAVLVAESIDAEPRSERTPEARGEGISAIDLDPSQETAAKAAGPVLVVAGPGTGKTRTLTGRVAHLVGSGADPERVLALTYSNRAADEMRGRVSKALGDAAHKVWMGTFHAFGLELLHKYNEEAGLPLHPKVLDPVDASVLLEGALGDIDLGYYEALSDPGRNIPDILDAISRAKDEVVGPEEYAALADAMRAAATDPKGVENAGKAQDVARAYAAYQDLLQTEGALDFGDLIYRSVLLLESNGSVRDRVEEDFPHVLVDEFQDVNRASGRLLKAVAGEGRGLWIVGDPRQSIYRWRGASSANFDRLRDDFPALRTEQLTRNYRSRPAVVKVVSEIATSIRAAPPGAFEPWETDRDEEEGVVSLSVATTLEAEGLGLARAIRDHALAGGEDEPRWQSQAVLCRTHTLLERYSRVLEAAGVPTLYLGDVFERDEVRDLLSLVSLISGGGWGGLVRVASFPEYGVPRGDIDRVLAWSEEDGRTPLQALSDAAGIDGLTTAGVRGLTALSDHVSGLHPNVTVWEVLSGYLFDHSEYVRHLAGTTEVETRQKRLAVYQLLALALGHRSREGAAPGYSRRSFLDYVRRISLQSEDRQIRQVPEWADDINAVRLMTVHASKGLEFDVVHVPALAKTYFPNTYRTRPCPLPDGLVGASPRDLHDDEEECLFFVAASRARDALHLSRADKYLNTFRDPSTLLGLAAGSLPADPQRWTDEPPETPPDELTVAPPIRDPGAPFTRFELDTYLTCPRRYAYAHVLRLDGRTETTAYVDFHRAARKAVRYVLDERAEGRTPTPDAVEAMLDEAWANDRLGESPYGDRLRVEAQQIATTALDAGDDTQIRPEWAVHLRSGTVTVRPDVASRAGGQGVVQKWKTGRLSKTEADKEVYALLHQAAAETYGAYTIEAVQFDTDERTPMRMTDAKRKGRLEKYAKAIDGVMAGDFHTEPSSRVCPRCPFFFVCPK